MAQNAMEWVARVALRDAEYTLIHETVPFVHYIIHVSVLALFVDPVFESLGPRKVRSVEMDFDTILVVY